MPPKIKRSAVEILRSHTVSTLKKAVRDAQQWKKGYSKLGKEDLIKLMTQSTERYEQNFRQIKYRETKQEKSTREAAEKVTKEKKEKRDAKREAKAKPVAKAKPEAKAKPVAKAKAKRTPEQEAERKRVNTANVALRTIRSVVSDTSKPPIRTGGAMSAKDVVRRQEKDIRDLEEATSTLKMMLKEEQAKLAQMKKSKAPADDIKRKMELIRTIKMGIQSGFID